jgi:RecB family exonuclease
MATPKPWSHSSINQFETCGRQYEELKVLRNFQDTKNPAALWGDEFHKAAEKYIREAVVLKEQIGVDATLAHLELHNTLPANMMNYAVYLRQFIERPGKTLVEQEYALNRALQPTGFYAEDVWGRGIIDVLTLNGDVAEVDDHKTGKNRKKDMQQLIIFALMTFYHHPEINTCHTAYHWLQLGAKDTETFHRHQIPELWETLIPKLDRYMRAFHIGVFHPKKSGLCRRHCPVNTCEYWGGGS